jgi:hypothetical protein
MDALAGLLAHSLGARESADLVRQAVQRLGFDKDALDMDRAAKVLESLAQSTGVTGITAQFAKARLYMLFL